LFDDIGHISKPNIPFQHTRRRREKQEKGVREQQEEGERVRQRERGKK
jgi:hypothetical protein